MRSRINRLRRRVTQLMCYLFLYVNCQQAKVQAQGILTPVSITILLVTAVTGAVVVVRMIRPTYRCWSDPEKPGTNWCSTMSMIAGRNSGYVWSSINFKTYKDCIRLCSPPATGTNALAAYLRDTNAPATFTESSAPQGMVEMYVVQKSYDLHSWISCGALEDVGNNNETGDYYLEYKEPYEPRRQCFFRVMVAYVEDPALLKKKL